jgi:hypothetical protein
MKDCRKETTVCQEATEACLETDQEQWEDLTNISLEVTEACIEKTEANERKVENKTEACLEEMKVETIGVAEGPYGDK